MQKLADVNQAPLQYSAVGLTSKTAASRLKKEGFNELPIKNQRGLFNLLLEVFREPMFALLLGGGIVYLLLGDLTEALFLLIFACLSISITLVQTSKSEHVLASLRNLASPRALVMRDGKQRIIAGREVVRGDTLIISEGERVSADAKLASAHDLLVDESLLTGESHPVAKSAHTINPYEKNIFAGSLVVRGTGIAMVETIGLQTEMGKIGRALSTIETEHPHLQKQMRHLVRNFAIIGGIAGIVAVALFGILRGSWLEAVLSGIALGMSLLPQEFPLVMAVFMAMGAWRISQARVLTRRASAIESLGAVTVLCTDKTGTLTENKMTVVAIFSQTDDWQRTQHQVLTPQIQTVLNAALYASHLHATDPMDVAIHTLTKEKLALNVRLRSTLNPLRSYGLRPDCFAVAYIYKLNETTLYTKGALETILPLCTLSESTRTAIHAQAEGLANDGMRVLAIAQSTINDATEKNLPPSLNGFKLEYIGLVGFTDPLRSHVRQAVAQCHAAGIQVMMITGDYPNTAKAIAKQAGIHSDAVMTGNDIEKMSDQALEKALKTTFVFARIKPHQKLRIVESLKLNNQIVAMTGDGVNDAPAIKAAHIGISMGGRGTDVAREASSIVLLDDDFGAIVKTIRLGRRVYDNLRKAIEYIIAVHIPIAGLAILPLLFGYPLILTPMHIALLEMLIDPACSIVFEAEAEESNVMSRPPRNVNTPLVIPQRVLWAVIQGTTVFLVLAAMLFWATASKIPEDTIRTIIFSTLVLMNMCLILVNRVFSASLFAALLRPNHALWLLMSAVSGVLAIAIFWQPARRIFHFGEFTWRFFTISLLASLTVLLLLELFKMAWFGMHQYQKKRVLLK